MATQISSTASHHTKNKSHSLSQTRFFPLWLNSYSLCFRAYLAYFQTYLAYSHFAILYLIFPLAMMFIPLITEWFIPSLPLLFHLIMSLPLDIVYCFVLISLFSAVSLVQSRCSVFKWMDKWVLMPYYGSGDHNLLIDLWKEEQL